MSQPPHSEECRLAISSRVSIPLDEIELNAVRSAGPGGQNVNKVSTAVHLRFDIAASSLPEFYKSRLLQLKDRRITKEGVVVIKAQTERSQERNRDAALERLRALIQGVAVSVKKRVPTKPSRAAKKRRLESKRREGEKKRLRRRPVE